MLGKDVSYLYSDDFLTSTSSNKIDSSCTKLSHRLDCRSIRTRTSRMPTSLLGSDGHRTKHIILFREDILKRDRQRKNQLLFTQLLKPHNQASEENLHNKLQELLVEQSHYKTHSTPLQSTKTDFKTKLNNMCANPLSDLFPLEKKPNPLCSNETSEDMDRCDLSLLRTSDLNISIDDNIDS